MKPKSSLISEKSILSDAKCSQSSLILNQALMGIFRGAPLSDHVKIVAMTKFRRTVGTEKSVHELMIIIINS